MSELVIDSGDTVWVLVSAALVLFMMPGLALFYAGLVRRGNVLAIMQQNLVPIAVISLTWILVGYSIAFSDDIGNGFMGDLGLFGLTGLDTAPTPALHAVDGDVAIPTLAFVAFQMMFAIITPALLTGATVGRLKTVGWVVTLALWSVLVYPFVAHWLFNPDGWLVGIGAPDWAGGIVVHAAAGAAALAVLVVVGRRQGWPRGRSRTRSRSPWRAQGSCGSAGSASTAAVRSRATASRRRRSSTRTSQERPPWARGSSWSVCARARAR